MKLSISTTIIALMAQSSSAFAPSNRLSVRRSSSLQMSDAAEPLPDPIPQLPKMSQSLPFLERPAALTGALPGDVGFDPYGFAKTEAELLNYREAELKHGRLAMLAAAGWPLSEVLDKKIAGLFGLTPVLDIHDRVPSVLNGGLGKISPLYWIAILGLAGAIDVLGITRATEASAKGSSYIPGDFGFDPLRVYPQDEEGKKRMQLAEIKNGRLAMIAIFAFAVQEAVTKIGVVDETPLFFFPLSETLKNYANSGYIQ